MSPLSLLSPKADACGDNNNNSMAAIPCEILQTNIVTRLDGPTLAAVGCTSSEFHALVTSDQQLWERICRSTWPSIDDPRVSRVIPAFRSGFRSFFSDAYPLVDYNHDQSLKRQNPKINANGSAPFRGAPGLISAVDIYYRGVPIFSKVVEMAVEKELFMCSPLRVGLLDAKEFVHPWIEQDLGEDDLWLKQVEEDVTLSWVLIDPERKRAVNLSSQRAVMAQRHWLTGEAQLKFAVVLGGGERGTEKEQVECGVVVTCGGKEGGGEVHVREVCMGMEDMEGRGLSGRDSLVILLGAMEGGKRMRGGSDGGEKGKRRFEEFLERKKEWNVMKGSKEKVLDLVSVLGGVLVVLAFWLWLFWPSSAF